jgi:ABC-2 type transport system permease protein
MTATAAAIRHSDPVQVALLLAGRNLIGMRRLPATFVPALIMPVFFVVSFSGQYDGITRIPGFETDNILSWYTPMATLMGASFGGLGTAFSAARDLETGFFDRLLLSPAPRLALMAGSIVAGVFRAVLTFVIVFAVGMIGGADVPGGVPGVASLLVAVIGVSATATMWGLGLVYRIKSMNAGPLVQVGIFLVLFLSTAQAPLDVIVGWLHAVAAVNPTTHVLELARQGFLGEVAWSTTWPGLLAIAGFMAVTALFALRGMRRLTP